MNQAKHIVIVGGGTAGWMAANLFAKQWAHKGFKITLIESPDIPTVGVGEGSTPYIKKFFDRLDINESEWMPKCNATYKNGIRFNQWSSVPGFDSYFHPFLSELDSLHLSLFEQNTQLKRKGFNVEAHPDSFFLMSTLTNQKRIPLPPKNFPFKNLYAYHFDAGLLGKFLQINASKLGVKHISTNVEKVELHLSGDIAAVHTREGEKISGDIFIDCTGFKALLIEKALKVPFHSYKDNLFNDSAVALPSNVIERYSPQTVSTAMSAGWAWEIPLSNRVGNGYVYSSAYQTAEAAEIELRAKLGSTILKGSGAKHLKMRVGRTSKHWYKNCVAVGLSQGFIEPLEATALHLVQNTIEKFISAYENDNFTNKQQNHFNAEMNYTFERVIDYVVLHYLSNTRKNSDYWTDCRTKIKTSDSLNQLMDIWLSAGDLKQELERQGIEHFYGSLSWHSMLAGVGIFPDSLKQAPSSTNLANVNMSNISEFLNRCAINYQKI